MERAIKADAIIPANDPKTALMQVIEESQVDVTTAKKLNSEFGELMQQAGEWLQKTKGINVTDESQVHDMQMARAGRLALRNIRIDADKKRKAMKENSLREGRAIQGAYNVLEYIIIPEEKRLEEQEKYKEIQEAKRLAERNAQREIDISPYRDFVPEISLASMTDEEFEKLINAGKAAMKQHLEEQARIKKEQEEKQRREAIGRQRRSDIMPYGGYISGELDFENMADEEFAVIINECKQAKKADEQERLRKDEEARKLSEELAAKRIEEAKKDAQRKEAEAKLKAERDDAERRIREAEMAAKRAEEERLAAIELAAREKREAEMAAIKEQKRVERQAQLAPDKDKLIALSNVIRSIKMPDCKHEDAIAAIEKVSVNLTKVFDYLEKTVSLMK